jgi:hypothetical protein
MRARLGLRLVALAAAIAIAAIGGPSHLAGTPLAGGVCPNGTNWDNSIHGCR